ncbi:MAG: hypothetical protein ACQR33_03405 [Candidatus Saccharibacteria bacterium]
MFKIIGAAVVYGFALFGFAEYFKATSNKQERAYSTPGAGDVQS